MADDLASLRDAELLPDIRDIPRAEDFRAALESLMETQALYIGSRETVGMTEATWAFRDGRDVALLDLRNMIASLLDAYNETPRVARSAGEYTDDGGTLSRYGVRHARRVVRTHDDDVLEGTLQPEQGWKLRLDGKRAVVANVGDVHSLCEQLDRRKRQVGEMENALRERNARIAELEAELKTRTTLVELIEQLRRAATPEAPAGVSEQPPEAR